MSRKSGLPASTSAGVLNTGDSITGPTEPCAFDSHDSTRAFDGKEFLDARGATARQVPSDDEDVNVGILAGRAAADRAEHGDGHEPRPVVRDELGAKPLQDFFVSIEEEGHGVRFQGILSQWLSAHGMSGEVVAGAAGATDLAEPAAGDQGGEVWLDRVRGAVDDFRDALAGEAGVAGQRRRRWRSASSAGSGA